MVMLALPRCCQDSRAVWEDGQARLYEASCGAGGRASPALRKTGLLNVAFGAPPLLQRSQ